MDLELKLNRNITDARARKALVDELLKSTPPEKLTTFFFIVASRLFNRNRRYEKK